MLDDALKTELASLFATLTTDILLRHDECQHPAQEELLSMLRGLAECSSRITVTSSGEAHAIPSFCIVRNGAKTGIRFSGVPGGHEFSSLVLAVLNSAEKGKLPDEAIQARIQALKGPIRLRTFVSLSCENCPDVVQMLNLFALIHSDFDHEMIDGGLRQEEVTRLGIQGVPSVLSGDTLLHSGRISLVDLLSVLEKHFGKSESPETVVPKDLGFFDVLVIGGGPAGSSAAIYSARKGLKTAIVADRIGGQLQETRGIENMISIPYTEGPGLSAELSRHLGRYPVSIFEHRKVKSISKEERKEVLLESGETIRAHSVIIASGAKWRELGIPGEKEYLGRGVAFCPHCDGPFYKGRAVAVIGGGNSGVEAAIDLAGIASHVTVFEYNADLKADLVLVDKLRSLPNTTVITNAKSRRIEGDGHKANALVYEDRTTNEERVFAVDGIFVQIGLLPNTGFLKGTLDLAPSGEIVIDAKNRTSAPGIYAAGDVTTTPFKQIIIAMGEGAKAALTAFEDRMLAGAQR